MYVIYRIPEGESTVFPGSHCTSCGHQLGALDLVPVFSYLLLGRKCRYCKTKISSQYMCIELLNAAFYGMSIWHFGFNVQGIMACILGSFMLVLTLIDIRYMLLPTSIIKTGVVIGLVGRAVGSCLQQDMSFLMEGLIGGLVGYLILAALFWGSILILKKEGMGYGDVRYMGLIGLFTSWQLVLLTLFLASVVGAVYGIIQLYVRKKSEPFPFGPFLSIGSLISLFVGNQMINWYMGLIWGIA